MTIVKIPTVAKNLQCPILQYGSPVLSLSLQQTTCWGLFYLSVPFPEDYKDLLLYRFFLNSSLCLSHQYPKACYTWKTSGHSSLKIRQVIFTLLCLLQFKFQFPSSIPSLAADNLQWPAFPFFLLCLEVYSFSCRTQIPQSTLSVFPHPNSFMAAPAS